MHNVGWGCAEILPLTFELHMRESKNAKICSFSLVWRHNHVYLMFRSHLCCISGRKNAFVVLREL